MIRKLRIKFIVIIMSLLALLMIVIFLSLNIMMMKAGRDKSYEEMRRVVELDGNPDIKHYDRGMGIKLIPQDPEKTSIYFVKLDADGCMLEMFVPYEDFISPDNISELVSDVLGSGKTHGRIGDQLFLTAEKDYGRIIVFCDEGPANVIMNRLVLLSFAIGSAALVVMFFVSIPLSWWVSKPVETAFEEQQRFVSDASHELKTPLTVISTNADVLRSEIGENKWLDYIRSEAGRMSRLVNDLLSLARLDSGRDVYENQRFSLSNAVTGAVLPFESVIFEAHKTLVTNIAPDVFYTGDEDKIKQLVVILTDNAVKNTFEGGSIVVSLTGDELRPKITVRNEGEGIDEADLPHIFERFYRCDNSRNRETGGFGLGLSIAKSIVDGHGGKISVASKKGQWTEFTAIL